MGVVDWVGVIVGDHLQVLYTIGAVLLLLLLF